MRPRSLRSEKLGLRAVPIISRSDSVVGGFAIGGAERDGGETRCCGGRVWMIGGLIGIVGSGLGLRSAKRRRGRIGTLEDCGVNNARGMKQRSALSLL